MDPVVERLLDANLRLTEQYTSLAKAVIESRFQGVLPQAVPTTTLPSFAEYAEKQEMTPEEKLFWSEDEEDQAFTAQMFGKGEAVADPQFMKDVLQAAGLEPHIEEAK